MATETSTRGHPASDQAIQGAFQAGTASRNGAGAIHLPLDHVDVGAGTTTATVAPSSVGDAGLPHETLWEMYACVALARALDERMWQVNRAGRAPFVVSGQGHEAA